MFQNQLSPVVRDLLIINVLAFVGTYLLLGSESYDAETGELLKLGRLQFAAYQPGSEHFQPYQIATYMFMHGNISHLFFNMVSLFFFGPMVEAVWGGKRFLFYYLFCGVGAWALHMGIQYWELSRAGIDPTTWPGSMLGASGAIFGLYAAFGYLFPNQVIQLLFPPIPLKAKYFVLIFGGLELMYGVTGTSAGVAHFAHIGGAVFGLGLIYYWYSVKR